MAKINIERNHQKSVADVKAGIDAMMGKLQSMGVDTQWKGDTLQVSGKGVKGTVDVTASQVAVHLDLGLPASLIKGKIEDRIREGLDKQLV